MTDHTPLTEQQRDEIAARAAHLHEYVAVDVEGAQPDFDKLTGEDVPLLLAEVRRRRTQVRFLVGAIARKDARTGEGDRALTEFLAAPEAADAPVAAERHVQAPEARPAPETAPQAERIRALTLLEAADFLRETHHRYGMNVQEISTALRHTADNADPMVGSLARDGFGLDEIANMLTPAAAPSRRLEDGSTHTVQALTDAGEECVQQRCLAARQEKQLRQEAYTLRAAVEGVLDEVRDMADDEQLSVEAAGVLRERLRSALGLDGIAAEATRPAVPAVETGR